MNSPRLMPALFVALLAGACSVFGQNLTPPPDLAPPTGTQIAWASDAFATNLMADGVTTFEASGKTIHFEIGTFSNGFDPSSASPESWANHWVILQGTDYNLDDQQFIETATLSSNSDPFAIGARAYVWGYVNKDLSKGNSEWILLTSALWSIPSSSAPLPSTFSVSDVLASEVILGSVGGPGGTYQMQLAAVPEPSCLLIGMSALLGLTLRRKR